MTGAAGQLGRSLIRLAPEHGVEAVGRTHAELDIADPEAVSRALDALQVDGVINAAAFTQVDRCEETPEEAMRVNAEGPAVLARALAGVAPLIHISTEYVFAGKTNRPVRENQVAKPLSVYGWSKLVGEEAVREQGGAHLIVRSQWLFGPGTNFVRTILGAALREPCLWVVEDQIGRPTWTDELAGAILRAASAGIRGTLHLACEGIASWYDLAAAAVAEGVRRGWVPPVEVQPIRSADLRRPARRPTYAVLGLDRARGLGLRLRHWREALTSYLDARKEAWDA
ncbi:MAG: dTDP-4-dehydrorhamnose reductase [Myxococcota bacterium]